MSVAVSILHGAFSVQGLLAGTYRVVVDECPNTTDNYAPTVFPAVTVAAGEQKSLGNVAMVANPVAGVPSALQSINARGSKTALRIKWRKPADAGASPVTSYLVTVHGPSGDSTVTVAPNKRGINVKPLPSGLYSADVRAQNAQAPDRRSARPPCGSEGSPNHRSSETASGAVQCASRPAS